MAGMPQNRQKRLIFTVVFQVRSKMREKGKRQKKKNMRMDKSKENTIIYMHMHIYTHMDMQTYINTDTHIHSKHIMCYSSQIVFFDIMFQSV